MPERIADATLQGEAGTITRPDRTRQPVDRGVGQTDGVGFVGERGHGHHRPEDLLGHHPARRHAALHHRRGEPVARTVRTVVAVQHRDRVVEERADPFVLTTRDQRAHVGAVVRAADAPRGRGLDQAVDEPAVRARLDEDAAARAAVLTGVSKTATGAPAAAASRSASANTTFGDFPPSWRGPLHRAARRRGLATGRCGPGEAQHVDVGWAARAAPVVGRDRAALEARHRQARPERRGGPARCR